jgi:two-component system chemotaxis sensor kinase CheA
LNDVLEIPSCSHGNDRLPYCPIVVLGSADTRIAFQVDAILNEQEVLVKPLGKPLQRVRNIAGATILGSGKPIPIINPADLLKSASKLAGAPSRTTPSKVDEAVPQSPILLVEDSITSRMLLKNILQSAGYQVTTAVDGFEAWAALQSQEFALVVSDVDMPHMDGFELTAHIRADKSLEQLPVVLVTVRESREDRERGVDVGANAYLVKSSFEQSNLLEIIRRLI